jgi:hypothetical protein
MAEGVLQVLLMLHQTPVPSILMIAGLVLIILAILGRIGKVLDLSRRRQGWAAAIGVIFVLAGGYLYVGPGLDWSPPPSNSASSTPSVSDPLEGSVTPNSGITGGNDDSQSSSASAEICTLGKVKGKPLLVRDEPGTTTRVVDTLQIGDEVSIICYSERQESSLNWVQIEFTREDGTKGTGWVPLQDIL